MILTFFILLQIGLLLFLTLHDWIHIPPLTNIRELEKHHSKIERFIGSIVNGSLVINSLFLTWHYQLKFPLWASIIIIISYSLLAVGTICLWWIPYLFGSSEKHKKGLTEYKDTHHFLPAIGDNVIPNTLHVIIHLQIWLCLGIFLCIFLK